MLWVKKCRNLSGRGIFPNQSEYFAHAENLELLFMRSLVQVAIVDKIIRGNIVCNLYLIWENSSF